MNYTLQPVSSDLVKVRYYARLPWIIVVIAACILWVIRSVWLGSTPWWALAGACVATLVLLWQMWLIPQQVRNLGWKETAEDLLLTRGKIWQTFTIIPYGRVQYVDVEQGPLERLYGLKRITLNTASTTSQATIYGLAAEEADVLRERITRRAKEKMIDL